VHCQTGGEKKKRGKRGAPEIFSSTHQRKKKRGEETVANGEKKRKKEKVHSTKVGGKGKLVGKKTLCPQIREGRKNQEPAQEKKGKVCP